MKICQHYPPCPRDGVRMVKLAAEAGKDRVELLTGIVMCAHHFPSVGQIGPHMKKFLKDKLPKRGFLTVSYSLIPVPLDSDEVRIYWAGAPN